MPDEDYETQLLEGLRILARLIARRRARASCSSIPILEGSKLCGDVESTES